MAITFSNIRNVRQKGNGYVCTINLITEAGEETVEYYAVPNGGGICGAVIEAIQNGEHEGKIAQYQPRAKTNAEKRAEALAARWPDPFALLDDILERGTMPVKAERDAIKAANPKS